MSKQYKVKWVTVDMLKLSGIYSCQSKHGSSQDSNKSVWRQRTKGLIRQIAQNRFYVMIYDAKEVGVRDLFCFESESVFVFCSRHMTADWLYQFTLFYSFFLMGVPEMLHASLTASYWFLQWSPEGISSQISCEGWLRIHCALLRMDKKLKSRKGVSEFQTNQATLDGLN